MNLLDVNQVKSHRAKKVLMMESYIEGVPWRLSEQEAFDRNLKLRWWWWDDASNELHNDEGTTGNGLNNDQFEYENDGNGQSPMFAKNDEANDDFDDDSGGEIEMFNASHERRVM